MKKQAVRVPQYFCIILFFSFTFTFSLVSQPRYYRGNTHTHSYPASGDVGDPFYRPSKIVSEYKALGYDFIVFTDHGTCWDAEGLSTGDFTVISGEELGVSYPGQQGHYSGINLWNTIIGAGIPHAAVIELILGQRGIPILNHPTWAPMALSAGTILVQIPPSLRHMEIVNASTMNEPETRDLPLWDELLSAGRSMYGIASDDSHREDQQGKAWIMVYAQNNKKESLLDAIQKGDYYCSSGIIIDSMSLNRQMIFVRSRQCDTIVLIGKNGISLQKKAGSEISYIPQGNEGYVRVELSNTKGERAWSQPVFFGTPAGAAEISTRTADSYVTMKNNFPNPFNNSTTIEFDVHQPCTVRCGVFNLLGQKLESTEEDFLSPGSRQFRVQSLNASGVYFLQFEIRSSNIPEILQTKTIKVTRIN